MSEKNKTLELKDEDLEKVSGGTVNPVGNINNLVKGNFYTVAGNSTQLFRVDYINYITGTIICGIYNYDSTEDKATNTKGSTTNYGPNDLYSHKTPTLVIL